MADETREFVRNYEDCFVALPLKSGLIRPFLVAGLTDSGKIQGKITTKSFKESSVSHESAFVLENYTPITPSSGYFNLEIPDGPINTWTTAIHIGLGPDRQFKKALSASAPLAYSTVDMSPHFLTKLTKSCPDSAVQPTRFWNRALALHMAKTEGDRALRTFHEAFTAVDSGAAHSVAFARLFAMSLHASFSCPVVSFNSAIAGTVTKRRGNYVLWATPRIMHFKDFFLKRWGVSVLPLEAFDKEG
jgi:hypothetical protein